MKKTWQKALTLLLAVCLCVGLGASALAATGTGSGLSIRLNTILVIDKYKPGDTVNVWVTFSNNPGLGSANLKVKYNADVLTATEAYVYDGSTVNKGTPQERTLPNYFPGVTATNVDNPGEVGFVWVNASEDIDYNGTFGQIVFTVNSDAAGDSALYIEYDPDNFYNNSESDDPADYEVPVTYVDDQKNSRVVIEVEPAHVHTLTQVAEVPSTCTQAGTAAYWICTECSSMFADAAGTQPITAPAALPLAAHSMTKTDEVPSTCKEQGTAAYWTCSECKKMYADEAGTQVITAPVKLQLAAHTLTKTDEVPATCKAEGTAAYWTCSVCGKMFSDAAGQNEIPAPVKLPIGPHTLTKTDEVPSTCKEQGTAAYWTCSVCNKLFSDAQGKTEITEVQKLPLAAHTLTPVAEVPAQCEKEGTAAYWTCSVCNKLFSDAQGKTEIEKPAAIPALSHDWDDGIVTKPATCTEKGVMTYTCKNDSSHIKEEDIDIDPEAHDWTDWKVTKEPTDTEDGERQRSCKHHPDVIETEVIPHDVLFVITFDANGGTCTVESAKTNKNGMLETLPTATRDDYRFVGWFTAKTGGTLITTDFIFKADTTVYAQWQAARRSSGGFVDPRKWPDTPNFNKPTDPTQPTQPTDPVLPTDPTQPAAPAQPTLPFGDVAPDRWSYADILFVYENGLMNGTSDSIFAPAADVTRGMIVTILYRLEGSPAVTDACPFADVKAGSYYEKPITWAAANGIVTGYSADRFGPDDPITREQLAAILYRYAQTKGEGFTGAWYFPLDFADAASVSEWADEAMHWCVMNGLINGSNGSLNPAGTASREQTAAILHRFCENFVK